MKIEAELTEIQSCGSQTVGDELKPAVVQLGITGQELTATPVSDILCGNFIELGYGVQVEGMSAELLFNRSFEPFTPYNSGSKDWFGLFYDFDDKSKGYKTDWSEEDWYHSGYEHNPWFAAPGYEGPLTIVDDSSYIVNESYVPGISIKYVPDARHGAGALQIFNGNNNEWGGAAQNGVRLAAGATYQFRGWFKGCRDSQIAELRFYPEGNFATPIAVIRLTDLDANYALKTVEWTNSSYEGRATFAVYTSPGNTLTVDGFSLMPCSNVFGWRKDVIDICKELNPKVIRFPGGCFASFYDWRRGVGPLDGRLPEPSYFWGGMNYNDVGTAEFAKLCQALGSQMMICVNLFHQKKKAYCDKFDTTSFTKREDGIRYACDWVAYCNASSDHPMGRLRGEHGYPEPFKVKYWEMDNEAGRWFTPLEYSETCVAYSRAMKAVDPSIKIGMMVYDDSFKRLLGQMLQIAGRDIDFIADRGGVETDLETHLQAIRDYNAMNGTSIGYADTEWLADDFRSELFPQSNERPRTFWFNKWTYALNIVPCVMTWMRKGGEVLFFNFNNLANTHGQSAIETPKEGSFLTGAGKLLALISRSKAAWPLRLTNYTINECDDFQVQAAWDLGRRDLIVFVFNRTNSERSMEISLSGLAREFTRVSGRTLWANSLLAYEKERTPERILDIAADVVLDKSGRMYIGVPQYSFSAISVSTTE